MKLFVGRLPVEAVVHDESLTMFKVINIINM